MEPTYPDETTEPVAARPWPGTELPAQRKSVPPRPPVQPAGGPSAGRVIQFVYVIFSVAEILIAIRIVLELLAANSAAGFSAFIYGLTDPLVNPFAGVFPTPARNGHVVDAAALLAIFIYALLEWLVVSVVRLVLRRRTPSAPY